MQQGMLAIVGLIGVRTFTNQYSGVPGVLGGMAAAQGAVNDQIAHLEMKVVDRIGVGFQGVYGQFFAVWSQQVIFKQSLLGVSYAGLVFQLGGQIFYPQGDSAILEEGGFLERAGGLKQRLGDRGGQVRKGAFYQSRCRVFCLALPGVLMVEDVFPSLPGVVGHLGLQGVDGFCLCCARAQQGIELRRVEVVDNQGPQFAVLDVLLRNPERVLGECLGGTVDMGHATEGFIDKDIQGFVWRPAG